MLTIAMVNQKGGVGKTSTCHHLAGALSWMGMRVLLIDADPQSSLTQGLLGPERWESLAPAETVAACFEGLAPLVGHLALGVGVPSVRLVPGSAEIGRHNAARPWLEDLARQVCLGGLVEDARHSGEIDVCLIDSPPNLHLCTWAAVQAADWVVIPTQAEDYGAQGVKPVIEFLAMARGANPRLQLAGVLISRFERGLSIQQVYEAEARERYGDDVFRVCIPKLTAYTEAIAARKPVQQYKPRSPAAEVFRSWAIELMQRIEAPASKGVAG